MKYPTDRSVSASNVSDDEVVEITPLPTVENIVNMKQ